jgi:eukaryotic-like serine/threonine-protein kinase
MRSSACLLVLMFLLTCVQPALAVPTNEWPQFRADSHNSGASDNVAPTSGQVLWKFDLGNPTRSSPTVAAGRVFIGDSDGSVWALDAETGQKIWSFRTNGSVESSPTYYNGRIYIGSDDNNLYALDATNGHLVWTFNTHGTVKSSVSTTEFIDGNGSLVQALIFGSYDNYLYSIDTNGMLLWKFKAASFIHGKPGIYNGMAFTCTCDKTMYGIDVETGQKDLNVTFGDYSAASPAIVNGFIYGTARGGKVFTVNLSNQSIAWQTDLKKTIESSPAVGDGLVIVGDMGVEVVALNATTGAKAWTFPTSGAVDGSVAIVGGQAFVGDGSGYLYSINTLNGKEAWNFHADGVIDSSPAVAYGKVYFGTEAGSLYALSDNRPLVQIISPKPWETVKGKIVVRLAVFGHNITKVEIAVDGANWQQNGVLNTSGPRPVWEFVLDTNKLTSKEHELNIHAINATGTGGGSEFFIVKNPKHQKPFLPSFDLPTTMGVTIFVAVLIKLIRNNGPKKKGP